MPQDDVPQPLSRYRPNSLWFQLCRLSDVPLPPLLESKGIGRPNGECGLNPFGMKFPLAGDASVQTVPSNVRPKSMSVEIVPFVGLAPLMRAYSSVSPLQMQRVVVWNSKILSFGVPDTPLHHLLTYDCCHHQPNHCQ